MDTLMQFWNGLTKNKKTIVIVVVLALAFIGVNLLIG